MSSLALFPIFQERITFHRRRILIIRMSLEILSGGAVKIERLMTFLYEKCRIIAEVP